jgi:hypothetical protein
MKDKQQEQTWNVQPHPEFEDQAFKQNELGVLVESANEQWTDRIGTKITVIALVNSRITASDPAKSCKLVGFIAENATSTYSPRQAMRPISRK